MNTLAAKNISVTELKKLKDTNPVAAQLFQVLALRTNSSRISKVDGVARTLGVNRTDLIVVFRSLGELGCGRFVVGRKGHQSRFEWEVSLVDVGKAAMGSTTSIKLISDNSVSLSDEDDDVSLIKHTFQFRSDAAVTFELPSDLTANEAERIAQFIKVLPMEQD